MVSLWQIEPILNYQLISFESQISKTKSDMPNHERELVKVQQELQKNYTEKITNFLLINKFIFQKRTKIFKNF